jgi:hypothetical protein
MVVVWGVRVFPVSFVFCDTTPPGPPIVLGERFSISNSKSILIVRVEYPWRSLSLYALCMLLLPLPHTQKHKNFLTSIININTFFKWSPHRHRPRSRPINIITNTKAPRYLKRASSSYIMLIYQNQSSIYLIYCRNIEIPKIRPLGTGK